MLAAPPAAVGQVSDRQLGDVTLDGNAEPGNAAPDSAAPDHIALDKKLSRTTSLTLTATPIRDALSQLATSHDVAILLDRRVDPSRPIDLVLSDVTLDDAIGQIAAAAGAGAAQVASVVYVGPPKWAAVAQTSATLFRDELSVLAPPRRRGWHDERVWTWPDLATPRRLIAEVQRAAHSKIEGDQRVPHDLWPAANLGRLAPCDLLSLLAVEFGLRGSVDAESHRVTLVDLDPALTLRRSYAAAAPREAAKVWRELSPGATVAVTAAGVVVDARAEAHQRYQELAAVSGSPSREPTTSSRPARRNRPASTYTLQLKNAPLEEVLAALDGQLITLVWDRDELTAAGIALDQLVDLNVTNSTVDEILSSVLEPIGLVYRIEREKCYIEPAKLATP